jgi:hypothetical protein
VNASKDSNASKTSKTSKSSYPSNLAMTSRNWNRWKPKKVRTARSATFRRVRNGVLAALLVATILVGASVGQALAAPGTDSVAARLAEWARTHSLGWVVTNLEQAQYALVTKPKTGGSVAGGLPKDTHTPLPTPTPTPTGPDITAAPAPLVPLVSAPQLAGEGLWQDLYSVQGLPAARVAFLRPDSIHTSYYVQVVWMDPKLVSFSLHPGYQVPGGTLTAPDQIPPSEITTILATFNSGFQMRDARGGYWQNGQTIVPLRTGAASMVLSATGQLAVESWPGGNPAPGVVAVRQNLDLLIQHGVISPAASQANAPAWGSTVGNREYVWRSAVGVRADGSVISVVGPAMNIESLANILLRAGAVDAMELDINPDWTNYITYTHPSPGVAVPSVLPPPDPYINPNRYLQSSSRDFVSVLPR